MRGIHPPEVLELTSRFGVKQWIVSRVFTDSAQTMNSGTLSVVLVVELTTERGPRCVVKGTLTDTVTDIEDQSVAQSRQNSYSAGVAQLGQSSGLLNPSGRPIRSEWVGFRIQVIRSGGCWLG
jgi:hypothetical protein